MALWTFLPEDGMLNNLLTVGVPLPVMRRRRIHHTELGSVNKLWLCWRFNWPARELFDSSFATIWKKETGQSSCAHMNGHCTWRSYHIGAYQAPWMPSATSLKTSLSDVEHRGHIQRNKRFGTINKCLSSLGLSCDAWKHKRITTRCPTPLKLLVVYMTHVTWESPISFLMPTACRRVITSRI